MHHTVHHTVQLPDCFHVSAATAAADLNLYNEFLKLSNGQYAELFYPAGYAS
jgi:hypothetical protein